MIAATRTAIDRYNRRLSTRVDAVVCASRYSAAELEPHATHVDRIPLGVDHDRFRPRPAPPREQPTIVVAVRLSPEKRPGLLLDTSRALLDAGCRHQMVVYGDGPLRRQLIRRAVGLPVHFAGFLSDRDVLACEMGAADVGIAPGPLETFGLAALELLASGTPVVVPDRGALAEIADGTCAVAAEPSGHGFARALRSILDGDREQQRTAAIGLARRFTWDRTVDAMLDVFARELGNSVRGVRTCSRAPGS